MLPNEAIKKIFAEQGGVMRTCDLHEAHLYYNDIQALIERGVIELSMDRQGKHE